MKATGFDPRLYEYLSAHHTPEDEILGDLRRETLRRFGDRAVMQISPDQGILLRILVSALGADRVLEIGTFTGYSSICMARGLGGQGRLLALDSSSEFTDIAREYWRRAGLDDRIELRLAPALESLRSLPRGPQFDFVFVDADKSEYIAYYEEILPRVREGGLIAVDNVLWEGEVIHPDTDDQNAKRIRAFNRHVVEDDRVEVAVLAVADGLSLILKK